MNLLEQAQARWPSASPVAIEELLWLTPYPFISGDQIIIALDKMKAKWGDDINAVINGEMAEFDAIFAARNKLPGESE